MSRSLFCLPCYAVDSYFEVVLCPVFLFSLPEFISCFLSLLVCSHSYPCVFLWQLPTPLVISLSLSVCVLKRLGFHLWCWSLLMFPGCSWFLPDGLSECFVSSQLKLCVRKWILSLPHLFVTLCLPRSVLVNENISLKEAPRFLVPGSPSEPWHLLSVIFIK